MELSPAITETPTRPTPVATATTSSTDAPADPTANRRATTSSTDPVANRTVGTTCAVTPVATGTLDLTDRRGNAPIPSLFRAMAATHGVTDSKSARLLGITRKVERSLLERGVLTSPAAGVLVSAAAPATWEQRARAAVLAPGSTVLSHGSAARLHGLDGFDRYEGIDVLCKKGSWPQPPAGATARHTRGLTDDDITEVRAIPTLTVAATLTLLAPSVGRDRTARALDSALRAGASIEELTAVAMRWRRPGRAGPTQLLRLLDERDGRTVPRSWFQRLAKQMLECSGVLLVDEYSVRTADGVLLAELDLAEPRRRIGVECQSWRWHATPDAQHRDARRRGMLRQLGWEIVDVWWRDLDDPRRVIAELDHLLRTRPPIPVRAN